jgi:hypothetical protein
MPTKRLIAYLSFVIMKRDDIAQVGVYVFRINRTKKYYTWYALRYGYMLYSAVNTQEKICSGYHILKHIYRRCLHFDRAFNPLRFAFAQTDNRIA